jgi:hypothetical protein
MSDISKIAVGKPKTGGALYYAPKGTAVPTDATTALGSTFVQTGYISEDGLTQEITRDSEDIKAWGGDTVMSPQTEYSEKFTFSLLETLDVNVKKLVYGDANVTETNGAITAISNSAELAEHAMVIEMVQGGRAVRRVIPCAKVTEIGEITYVDGEPIAYELTVTALPDASGNASYEYTAAA